MMLKIEFFRRVLSKIAVSAVLSIDLFSFKRPLSQELNTGSYIIIVNKTLTIRYTVSAVNFEIIDIATVHWGSLGLNLSIF